MELFTVAFFGHRCIEGLFSLEALLEKHIRALIDEKEYVEFLVGRNGDFDQLVSSMVRRIKKNYRDDNSAIVLILPYATADYFKNQEAYEKYYDNVEISYNASTAHPRAAIQIRNREMVDRADLIICYVDHESGGAYQTIRYAEKQGKKIINLADIKSRAGEQDKK